MKFSYEYSLEHLFILMLYSTLVEVEVEVGVELGKNGRETII